MTLELEGITKKIGAQTHIHETNLKLERDAFNILLGATNAGKSTLIRLMAGLDRPTKGEVFFDGERVTELSPQKRNIALVHQFFINYPHLTVYENIASPLRVRKMSRTEIDQRVRDSADLLQLGPMLDRRPQELSGGQQQRTALARAIVKESRAIFLDEPLANLDYKLREELREQLPEILSQRGTVVVYATSDPTEALLIGGNTALVHEGSVAQFGRTADIYRSPANLSSARVFSDPPINLAKIHKTGSKIVLDQHDWQASGDVLALADGQYTIGIRPHHVVPTAPSPPFVRIRDRVDITELSGTSSVAHFSMGKRNWVSLAAGTHPYRVGDMHDFYLLPEKCLYFDSAGILAAVGTDHG
ncbi:MAG: ABC transporter ATP-binding protein [Rhodobacteraceae bacterium]|nr:ABC transporter ATP-binding protein [Paracoccaceae bacterium]MCY4195490.1 ABC transporter ATP-binding protein [Paracoccaceae bacterium]